MFGEYSVSKTKFQVETLGYDSTCPYISFTHLLPEKILQKVCGAGSS